MSIRHTYTKTNSRGIRTASCWYLRCVRSINALLLTPNRSARLGRGVIVWVLTFFKCVSNPIFPIGLSISIEKQMSKDVGLSGNTGILHIEITQKALKPEESKHERMFFKLLHTWTRTRIHISKYFSYRKRKQFSLENKCFSRLSIACAWAVRDSLPTRVIQRQNGSRPSERTRVNLMHILIRPFSIHFFQMTPFVL